MSCFNSEVRGLDYNMLNYKPTLTFFDVLVPKCLDYNMLNYKLCLLLIIRTQQFGLDYNMLNYKLYQSYHSFICPIF